MHLFHHYHSHHVGRTVHSDFWWYELSVWLHTFGRSFVAVFIPILLLNLGYSIGDVIVYYMIYNAFDVPLNFFGRWMVEKVGARWVIGIGTVWSILFFALLSFLTLDNWPIILLLAFCAAMYDALYWVAHVFLFVESTGEEKDAGKKTGILSIVQRLGGLLGPAIGAAILIFFSDKALLYASIVVLATSLLPLLKVDDFPDKPTVPRTPIKEFFSRWRERKNFLSSALFSIHRDAEGVLWPMFVFVVLGSIESVAFIPIVVSITTIIFTYFTSHIRRNAREKYIVLGACLIALVWMSRMFVETELFLYVSVFLVGLFSILISIPLDSNLFTRAKEVDPLGAATYRNATHMFAKFLLYAMLALVLNVFQVSFILAMVCLFVLMAVNYYFVSRYKTALA